MTARPSDRRGGTGRRAAARGRRAAPAPRRRATTGAPTGRRRASPPARAPRTPGRRHRPTPCHGQRPQPPPARRAPPPTAAATARAPRGAARRAARQRRPRGRPRRRHTPASWHRWVGGGSIPNEGRPVSVVLVHGEEGAPRSAPRHGVWRAGATPRRRPPAPGGRRRALPVGPKRVERRGWGEDRPATAPPRGGSAAAAQSRGGRPRGRRGHRPNLIRRRGRPAGSDLASGLVIGESVYASRTLSTLQRRSCGGCMARRQREIRSEKSSPQVTVSSLQGDSPTERQTESLLGNSRTTVLLLGRLFGQQIPNRTPFCSAPLLVCLVGQFLHCLELDRVTALHMVIDELLHVKACFSPERKY